MLPEAGATELIFLAAVALIVVGPKDLPVLLRKVGQFMAKMRGLAAEFRASFDELARQSELDELRREVDALRTGQYMQPLREQITSHTREIDQHFDALHSEFGAPPPPPLTEAGVILPAPDAAVAPAPIEPPPNPALAPVAETVAPPTSADEAAAAHDRPNRDGAAPDPHPAAPARETAG